MKKLVKIIVLFMGLCCFASCTNIKGTYTWVAENGYTQTIIINSNKEMGPCIWRGENGEQTNESYSYNKYVSDRPQLYIRGIALIDVKNKMVYSSSDDFDAYRNGIPCKRH